MLDLKRIFRAGNALAAPDLRDEIERRLAKGSFEEMQGNHAERHRMRRPTTIVLSFAVFLAAGVLLWQAFDPRAGDGEQMPMGDEASGAPSGDWPGLESGFNQVPAPPVTRGGQAIVWTGSRLIAWGGELNDGAEFFNDGYEFDPQASSWTKLPKSPLRPRAHAAAVWTGTELVIWGGSSDDGFLGDGAAFNPTTGTWRPIPPSPLDDRIPLGAVWTGEEMLVWGSSESMSDREDRSGAEYDPASDSWRSIADAPLAINRGSVVWSGEEMVVVGAHIRDWSHSESAVAVASAYDPVSDSWRLLPETDLDPNGTFATWAGGQLIALDYNHRARAYDVEADGWRELPALPLEDGESWPSLAAVPGAVFVRSFGGPAVLDPANERWETDLGERDVGFPVTAGGAIVLWPGELLDSPHMLVWKP